LKGQLADGVPFGVTSLRSATTVIRFATKYRSRWRALSATKPFGAAAALTVAANLTIAALSILTGVVSARLLGPHGRGELAAIQTAPGFIATLAMLGMPEALTYFSAQQPLRAGRYLATASAIALATCLPFMAAGFVAMPTLLHAQRSQVISSAQWCLLIAPIWAVASMPISLLRGIGAFAQWNALRVMVPLSIIVVLAVAYTTGHVNPPFIAYGWLVYSALFFLPTFWLVFRRGVRDPFRPDPNNVGPMLRYGAPCMLTGMPQMLNLRLDQMLMAALLPPRDLGLYVVAVAWSGAAAPLLGAVSAVMTPAVASATDVAHGGRRLAAGARGTATLAIVLCVILATLTPIAITFLFGNAFSASIPAAVVLVSAAGVLGLNLVLQEGLRGLGRPYAVLRAELAGLVVTAATLVTTLRPMGIMGAAIASLLGYSTVLGVLLINSRRYAGVALRELLLPKLTEIRLILERLFSLVRRDPSVTGDSL
jgi:O-antigen/teichoic acid export membrane protein